MKYVPMVLRILLGLLFTVTGLNIFLNFLPMPAGQPEAMMSFMGGMMAVKYFFPLLGATQLLCGLALVTGFFVPLALVIIAPVIVNIVLLHAAVQPAWGMSIFLLVAEIGLFYFYRNSFKPMLSVKSAASV